MKKTKAILSVNKGEEIAGCWVTQRIETVGFYKLLAKKRADGTCEWVHFLQRDDGTKKILFNGEVESEQRLKDVVDAINRSLGSTFGPSVKLQTGKTDIYSLDGRKFDDTVH